MAKPAKAHFPVRDEAEHISLVRVFAEDRRLRILQWLWESPGYTANQVVLADLLAHVGHLVSEDKIRADLAWLAELSLIDLLGTNALFVARLNDRGADVATGRAIVPGVSRAAPDR